MYKKISFNVIVLTALFWQSATSALAVTTPSFPTCINPQGSVKASYSSGTHGIVGSTQEYTGSDSVYTLSDNTIVQCFCPVNGNGIQTDWWKIANLSDTDIKIL